MKRKEELLKPPERFELSTPGLQDQCSNPWATEAYLFCSPLFLKKVITLFRTIPVDPLSYHVYCRGGGGEGGGTAIYNEKERIKTVKLKMETG